MEVLTEKQRDSVVIRRYVERTINGIDRIILEKAV